MHLDVDALPPDQQAVVLAILGGALAWAPTAGLDAGPLAALVAEGVVELWDCDDEEHQLVGGPFACLTVWGSARIGAEIVEDPLPIGETETPEEVKVRLAWRGVPRWRREIEPPPSKFVRVPSEHRMKHLEFPETVVDEKTSGLDLLCDLESGAEIRLFKGGLWPDGIPIKVDERIRGKGVPGAKPKAVKPKCKSKGKARGKRRRKSVA